MLNGDDNRSMPHHVGIEIIEVGPDFIKGSMPVDHRTKQPFGILHGGASVVLAETLGSIGGNFCLSEGTGYCVGLDINSNHIRSATEGIVIGTAKPYHVGRTTQVWHIEIHNEAGKLINISRLTLAVIKK
ncbi:MAG: hotdog fold thioesterase [Rhodothermales bacterium]